MSLLLKYYQRTFGDYYTMRSCLLAGNECRKWAAYMPNNKATKEDWEEKHRAWTYEPLMGDTKCND
jgi:hypothetical protein